MPVPIFLCRCVVFPSKEPRTALNQPTGRGLKMSINPHVQRNQRTPDVGAEVAANVAEWAVMRGVSWSEAICRTKENYWAMVAEIHAGKGRGGVAA